MEYEVRCHYDCTFYSLKQTTCNLAGDVDLLWGLFELIRRVPKDQFRSDISTFDLGAFMKSVNKRYYNGPSYSSGIGNRMVSAFRTWTAILASAVGAYPTEVLFS